jgi:hypothetical protein
MEKHQNESQKAGADIYDMRGPLWEKYFNETRKKVKFPRGYKELYLFE